MADNETEKTRSRGQIIQIVSTGVMDRSDLLQHILQALIRLRVVKISRHVIEPLLQPFPHADVYRGGGILPNLSTELLAKLLGRHGGSGETDDDKSFGKIAARRQVVERRKQLAFRQIAVCAKDDHYAGYLWRIGGGETHETTIVREIRPLGPDERIMAAEDTLKSISCPCDCSDRARAIRGDSSARERVQCCGPSEAWYRHRTCAHR